jgi:glycosyltransferase involved in cell wall biosynthesis
MPHDSAATLRAPNSTARIHSEPQHARRAAEPRVSIGLPVYNGERYLALAINSILAQDFHDLELIICDNASTDRTEEICAAFARRDPRLRYFRNPRNLGAGPNYDRCFGLARGTYFKWAAHDDCLAPGYLSRTVAALDGAPGAVLCTTGVAEIGRWNELRRVYRNVFRGIDSPSPATRLAAVIHTRHECEDFFGLFRREALLGSSLHGTYSGSDRVLLAEMAVRGPWISVPEPLFIHREHEERYTRAVLQGDQSQAALWLDTSDPTARASRMFHLVVYRHYLRIMRKNLRPGGARLACYAELLRWWFTNGHLPDVLRDLVKGHPHVRRQLRILRAKLLGTPPTPPGGASS